MVSFEAAIGALELSGGASAAATMAWGVLAEALDVYSGGY
jgi:hypothetical protein